MANYSSTYDIRFRHTGSEEMAYNTFTCEVGPCSIHVIYEPFGCYTASNKTVIAIFLRDYLLSIFDESLVDRKVTTQKKKTVIESLILKITIENEIYRYIDKEISAEIRDSE